MLEGRAVARERVTCGLVRPGDPEMRTLALHARGSGHIYPMLLLMFCSPLLASSALQVLVGCMLGFIPREMAAHPRSILSAHLQFMQVRSLACA